MAGRVAARIGGDSMRSGRERELIARVESYARQRDEERAQRKAAVNSTVRLAQRLAAVETEHAKQLAARDRQVSRLQARLDDALGLNSDRVTAGAEWQTRREDKAATS